MVFEWFKQFKDGSADIQDGPRSRCPSTSQNADNIVNGHEMVIIDGLT
jgi:uncharacterized Zn-binding protein involved in type VI secretion